MDRNQKGFTVTELAISITISAIMALVLFTATFNYYINLAQSETSTNLALESQSILSQLTDDIRLADSIASTNTISDPNGPGGGWVTSDPSNILIVESPATDSGRNLIYNNTTGFPYRNEYIYFSNSTNMYKRVLANTSAVGNTAVTSCPTATAGCPKDRLFSQNLSNLTFTFYDSTDTTTADATKARSVLFRVDMAKKMFGKNITISNSTRVTLRNQ